MTRALLSQPSYAKDVRGLQAGMERDVIAPSMPDVAGVGEQVVDFVAVAADFIEIFARRVDKSGLRVERIEIQRDENDAVARRGHLAVKKDRVVLGEVESKVVVEMQSAILAANPVQLCDQLLDIAGRIPIALL